MARIRHVLATAHAMAGWSGRLRRLGLVSVATILVLGSSVTAWAGPKTTLQGEDTLVVDHATSIKTHQHDPSSVTPGDKLFIGGVVRRDTAAQEQIGTFGIRCAATAAGGAGPCDGVFALPEGQITTEVLLPGSPPPHRFLIAVTGARARTRMLAVRQSALRSIRPTSASPSFLAVAGHRYSWPRDCLWRPSE